MKSCLDTVLVAADPQFDVLIHLSAGSVEEVIIVAYLCEALDKCSVIVIVSKSSVLDKAVYAHFSVGIEIVESCFYRIIIRFCYPVAAVSDYLGSRCSCIIVASVNHYESLADLDAVDIIELRTVSVADAVL